MDHQIKKDKQEIELLISEMNALLKRVASGKVSKQSQQQTTATGKDALFVKRQVVGYAITLFFTRALLTPCILVTNFVFK